MEQRQSVRMWMFLMKIIMRQSLLPIIFIRIRMGNSSAETSPKNNKLSFDPNHWDQIPLYSYTNNSDPHYSSNFIVISHKHSQGLEAEKYEVFFNSQSEYISYLDFFYERKKNQHLVNTLYIDQTTKRGLCSTFLSAAVFIERIPIRLFEIVDMPVSEGLYMMETALEGYEKMFEKTGYFQVSSDMIGINRQGKVKVWINRNFSKNFPDFNKIDHNQGECNFVLRVISIIDDAIDYSGHHPTFMEFIYEKRKVITFQTAKILLKLYIQNENISTPKIMKSILVVYRNHAHDDTNFPRSFFRKNNEKPRENQKLKRDDSTVTTNRKSQEKDIPIQEKQKQNLQKVITRQGNSDRFGKSEQKNAIHISFIKNEPKVYDLDDYVHLENNQIFNEHSTHTKTGSMTPHAISSQKNPSVSFYYRNPNAGLYSPQNMPKIPKPIYMGNEKQIKEKKREKPVVKREFRKSMPAREEVDNKMQYFNSNGDIHDIDPDIATDLERFSS